MRETRNAAQGRGRRSEQRPGFKGLFVHSISPERRLVQSPRTLHVKADRQCRRAHTERAHG